MPEITVRKIFPSTAITDTRRQLPVGLFDDQFAAQRGLARGVGQLGQAAGTAAVQKTAQEAQAAADTLRAQGEEEFTRAKLGYETRFRAFQDELNKDTDYGGYTTKFDAWHESNTAELLKEINHPGALTRATDQFTLNKAVRGKTIDANAQNSLVRQTRATLPEKMESFVSEELAADTPETVTKAVTERQAYFQTLIETGVLNAAEAEALERQYQNIKGQRVLQNTVTAIAVEEGWDEAIDWLNEPKNVAELIEDFGLDLADIDSILEDVKTQANISRADGKAELENQRTADRDVIVKSLRGDDLKKTSDLVAASALTPEEQFTWDERINKKSEAIIANTKIVTDERIRRRLESMANDIPIGSVTKEQVIAAADKARYTDETIDDGAYDQITAMADREHTSYQSTAMREAESFGQGQLISVTQSLLDTLLAGGVEVDIKAAAEKRDNELWNAGQYRKAMNDWLTQNPEADSNQIYIQSRQLITFYRRPIVEVEAARANFEARFIGPPEPPTIQRPPAKFANPVRVVDPDGKTGWSSEELFKSTLEPLGFKKIDEKIELKAER